MKIIITILLLCSANLIASPDYYYVEVHNTNNEQTISIEFTSFANASNAIPDIITEFVDYAHTTQIHKHTHYSPDTPNVPCEIIPMASGDKEVVVETIVDTTHRQTEYVKMDCIDEVDAVKKANKIKKSKYFVGKETKTKIKDKA